MAEGGQVGSLWLAGIIPKGFSIQKSIMSESEDIQRVAESRTMGELIRFGIVGVVHNLLGYLVYLLVTWLGADPKIAVAILYPLGTTVSYLANRRWTFNDKEEVGRSMTRYAAMHLFGYCLNLAIIAVGVDVLAFPHQLVQLFAMVLLAAMFFIMSKFLVFNTREG